jgi:hypothetical protein
LFCIVSLRLLTICSCSVSFLFADALSSLQKLTEQKNDQEPVVTKALAKLQGIILTRKAELLNSLSASVAEEVGRSNYIQ